MKTEYKVLAASIIFWLFVWGIDAVIDYLFFYEGTLLGIMIFEVPNHELFMRLVILACFVLFGIFMSTVIKRSRRAAEAMRESEESYRKLVNTSIDGVISIDSAMRVILWNPAAERIFGYTKEEMLGQSLMKIVPEKYREAKEKGFFEFTKKGTGPAIDKILEVEAIRKDMIEIPIELSVSSRKAGETYIATSIVRDITERKKAEQLIKTSLEEKEVLIKEIHHRVKNNLQVISSLINLQSYQIRGKQNKELFKESQNRIKSIAFIHEKLYQSKDLARIDFKEYTESMVSSLFRSYGTSLDKVALNIEAEEVLLRIDSAIPCGLIINELISNSLKHAFPDGKRGEINIGLHSSNEKDIELVVSDNGVGIPEDLDFRKTKSLGLRLVTILAEDQLHGQIKVNRKKGTKFQIKFSAVK